MRIRVKVIPNAKKSEVVAQSDGSFKVRIVAAPEKGKANKELVELLARHFGVKKSAVMIITGKHGRYKIVDITGP